MSAGLTLSRAAGQPGRRRCVRVRPRGCAGPDAGAGQVDDLLATLSGGDELSTRRILGHGAKVDVDLASCWTNGCACSHQQDPGGQPLDHGVS